MLMSPKSGLKIFPSDVVFFDLDDSLINKDANSLWIKWRVKHERWAVVEALQALISLYRAYKKGKITHKRLSNYYRTRTRGMKLSDYRQRIQDFFKQRGHLYIYPQAASLLFAYKQQGSQLVLITGQDEEMARAYGDALGMHHVIGNRLLMDGERIKGLQKPLCYGEGKVELATEFCQQNGFELQDAAFYSDNHSDMPLLEAVKYPVAINPNTQLSELAQERNWPSIHWRS